VPEGDEKQLWAQGGLEKVRREGGDKGEIVPGFPFFVTGERWIRRVMASITRVAMNDEKIVTFRTRDKKRCGSFVLCLL
jgi:hypothetical protein